MNTQTDYLYWAEHYFNILREGGSSWFYSSREPEELEQLMWFTLFLAAEAGELDYTEDELPVSNFTDLYSTELNNLIASVKYAAGIQGYPNELLHDVAEMLEYTKHHIAVLEARMLTLSAVH